MANMDIANPSEEHLMLREMVREWTQEHVEPQALEYDRAEKFNHELLRSMGELGLLGISAPEDYGGAGLDAVACTIVHEELSASDPGFTLAYLAHSMLFVNNLAYNGTDEQKAQFCPKSALASGLAPWPCRSLTQAPTFLAFQPQPSSETTGLGCSTVEKCGSPTGALTKTARQLTWYGSTLAPERTSVGESRCPPSSLKPACLATAWVRKSTIKPDARSNTAELVFDDCIVPAENLVGGVGESLLHMMGNLELERLTLAAMALGIARRALEEMNRYATDRTAFGSSIRDFGQIQRYIGESWAKYRAMRAYIYDTANNLTIGTSGQRLDSDGVKLFATTAAKEIADAAMQVMGGYGYVGEYHVERLWRDAKLLEIGGGTLESHQKNITRDLFKDGEAINR